MLHIANHEDTLLTLSSCHGPLERALGGTSHLVVATL